MTKEDLAKAYHERIIELYPECKTCKLYYEFENLLNA